MERNTSRTLLTLMSLCVCLSVITLGLVIYDRFIVKEPEHAILKPIYVDSTTENSNNKKFTKLEKIQFDDKGKKVTVNNKNITVKNADNSLYVNDKKVRSDIYSVDSAYVTDYFVMFISHGQGGDIYMVYDENGNSINIVNDGQFSNLRLENNKLIADRVPNSECIEDGNIVCDSNNKKVELVYSNNSLTVMEVK